MTITTIYNSHVDLTKIKAQEYIKRLSVSFLIARNKDFDEKLTSNDFSKWSSKYSHFLSRFFASQK